MSNTPYTYLIGWSSHNVWYYGVRYSKNCSPNDLWVKYFTSSRHVKNMRKLYGEPDIKQIRKTFVSAKQAVDWERKVLSRLNVFSNPKWLNLTKNNAFKRNEVNSWNTGLTKETNPTLKIVSEKISKAKKGKSPTKEALINMKKIGQERKKENSWQQLKKNICYEKYSSYNDFVDDIKYVMETCFYVPLLIAKELNVTIWGVSTAMKHHNIPQNTNQKFTKLVKNYGTKWKSYEEYARDIIKLHNIGYYPEKIAKTLGINSWGISIVLKENNLYPNIGKTGPSKKD